MSTTVLRLGYITERYIFWVTRIPVFIHVIIFNFKKNSLCSHTVKCFRYIGNSLPGWKCYHSSPSQKKQVLYIAFVHHRKVVFSIQVIFMLCLLMFQHEFTPIKPKVSVFLSVLLKCWTLLWSNHFTSTSEYVISSDGDIYSGFADLG